jgi:hypothetical protein
MFEKWRHDIWMDDTQPNHTFLNDFVACNKYPKFTNILLNVILRSVIVLSANLENLTIQRVVQLSVILPNVTATSKLFPC